MKIIPLYVPRNAYYFVAPEYYPGEPEQLAPNVSVLTAPLRFNQGIPFTELAVSDELQEQELVDPAWTINPERVRLEGIAFKIPTHDKLIYSEIGLEVADAQFGTSAQGQSMVLEINRKQIPVIISASNLVSWLNHEHYVGTPLSDMIDHDMHVRVILDLHGTVNVSDGHVAMLHTGDTRVLSVMDRRGKALDMSEGLPKQLKDYFSQLMAVGYTLDAEWLMLESEERYELELVDACPVGRGLAWLVKGTLGMYSSSGPYGADIVHPTADTYGTTTLYLEPVDAKGKPLYQVVVEENNGLQPGWMNIEFFGYSDQTERLESLGRYERILPQYVGHWAGAIGMFLVNGDHHRVSRTLPAIVPKGTTYAEFEHADPESVVKLNGDLKPLSME